MKKCVIIYNPQSGKLKKRKIFKPIENVMKTYGYKLVLRATKCRGDAINIVKKLRSADLVISAGGDGTLNEVITGNLKREIKFLIAHLPIGTANDIGSMYGMGQDIIHNLEMILNGVVKNVDICLINKSPFVYIAALGAYVDIAYATPRGLKEKYGKLGYIIYGIKKLKDNFQFYNIKYTVDGIEYEKRVSFIFITNATRFGGGVVSFSTDVKLDDNKFEVFMCDIKNKFDILRAVYHLKMNNDFNRLPGVTHYKTDNIDLEFEEVPSSWCVDGDELSDKSKIYKIRISKEMNMLLPSKNIARLFKEEIVD